MRLGEAGEADIAQRAAARPDQDRRAIQQQAIDQIGGEEGRCRASAAFDQDVIDIGECGDVAW